MDYPKLISIDTSVFGAIAKDYYCNNRKRCALAHNTITSIFSNCLVPLFSIHHLSEHLQHSDIATVKQRLSLIGELPALAWIRGNNPALPGSIIDVTGTELSLMINGLESFDSLITQARQTLIQYGSGFDLLNWCGDVLMKARELGYFETQKSKVIDSLLHVMDPDVLKVKLSVLKGATRRKPSDAIEHFKRLKVTTESELISRGDKKLDDAKGVADWFIQDVVKESLGLLQDNDLSFYDHLLQSYGLSEGDIDESTTIGDLGDTLVHREQVDIISRSYNINVGEALKFPIDSIPSSFIISEIAKSMRKEGRASGSNILDKYMAVFVLYVDYNIVDKRVNEYIRQISRKKNGLTKCIKRVAKVSHYSEIEKLYSSGKKLYV